MTDREDRVREIAISFGSRTGRPKARPSAIG